MSLNAKQNVRCPKCSQMSELMVWHSITVKDSADLKQDLLRGRVNMFHCPSCSYTALMPSPLLYHDEEKKLLISFAPCDERDKEKQLFDEVKKTFSDSGELKNYEGYNLRFVADYNELLEKILIFDNDFNDKVIEVIKLMVLSQDEEKAPRRSCRFGKVEKGSIEFMIFDREENQVYTSSVPTESYDMIYQRLRESGMKPYSFDLEAVNGDYASRLLNGFNN